MAIIEMKASPKVFQVGGIPSNHISFNGWAGNVSIQKIYGHKIQKPNDGDILVSEMKSNRRGLFVIHNVDCPGDPTDLFFANASFIGYEDEGIL